MAIQHKLSEEDGDVKNFIEALRKCKESIKNLKESYIEEGDIDEELLFGDYNNMLKAIKDHYIKTLTSKEPSKLTEAQTIADLNELWSVVKLLKGIRRGIMSREEMLGITDA